MKNLWKYYPVLFALPFLMAALGTEGLAKIGEVSRWLVLGGCILVAGMGSQSFLRVGFKSSDLVFIGFLGVALLSCLWSIDPSYSFQRALSMVLLYFCIFKGFSAYAGDFGQMELIKRLVGTAAVFLSVNLVLAAALGAPLGVGRFQGFFANPNGVGSMSGLCLAPLYYFCLTGRSLFWRAMFVMTLASLLLAGSRGPLIASLFAIIIISLPHVRRRFLTLVAVGGSFILFLGFLATTEFFKDNVVRLDTLSNLSNRDAFWELGRSYISDRPWAGFGFGSDALIHQYHGVDLFEMKLRGYGVMSSYLGLAVQIGVPCTLFFYGYLIVGLITSVFKYHSDFTLMVYAACTTSGLLIGIGESVLYSAGNSFSFLFWCFPMLLVERVAGIVASRNRQRRAIALRKRQTRRQEFVVRSS
jgi:O-antigen ligase